MASTAHTLQNILSAPFADTKTKDLARDTLDPKDTRSGGFITNQHGVRVTETQNWLKATDGTHAAPFLVEDVNAMEKIQHFDHERIPERVVHARGNAAHGHFKVFDDRASKYTFARVLTDASRTTPTFVRFSTVQGPRGSADSVRDVRGFATKFYTQEGNWDIVGNNMPVFFIQDAIQFPDFVHAVKPEPHNEVPTGGSAHNNFWDFFNLEKSTSHMVMWAMSDRGIPRSLRMMEGFGVNTYTLVNAKDELFYVKFHWMPELGVHSMVWDEALKVCGQDPDFHRKDLDEAIEKGFPPKWTFGIQAIPAAKKDDFDFDIEDSTKLWPKELVPVEPIGEMVLDRVVDEYFTEVEQVAFCTSHVVPGIGFSNDPLLQGRNFSYLDTQLSRLGPNWEELPINRPVCPVMNNLRDGSRRHKITKSKVNYWPNRFEESPPAAEAVKDNAYSAHKEILGGGKTLFKSTERGVKFKEYLSQAQLFYNSLSPYEKAHVQAATGFELSQCNDPLVYERAIPRINEIDHELAKIVAEKIGAPLPSGPSAANHGKTSQGLSQTDVPYDPTIKTRKIAILIADGFDAGAVIALQKAFSTAGAFPVLIGTSRKPLAGADGQTLMTGAHLEGARSTLFDAVLIAPGAKSVETLSKSGRAIHWVREAFGHCKTIGALGEGISLLRDAAILPSVQYAAVGSNDVVNSYGVVTVGSWGAVSGVIQEAIQIGKGDKGFLGQFATELSNHRNWQRESDGLTQMVAY
ncbi:catalase-domain-containing protein [Flagelloscypha sp. PMI_526]|nr:catalase-domain-containing protein [Flagelloscypha sp. PMI_526]